METGKISGNNSGGFTQSAVQSVAKAADDSFAKKLEAAVQNNDDKELKKACQEFEGIMLDILYKQMRATVIKSDLIEKDAGTEIFESMRDENLMEEASKTGSLGLAESLFRQLSKKAGDRKKDANKGAVQENKPVPEKTGE